VRLLLDTCTLSEVRHPEGAPEVKDYVRLVPSDNLYLSVISVGEVARGLALLADSPKKARLTAWLLGLDRQFGDRILPVDREIAMVWGERDAAAKAKGHTVPPADGLIAATAIRHGLHVATRNTDDFVKAGALVVNPWLRPS
jgi:predicted nucleic acid-binding protein